jgi:hypothetical protein
MHRAVLLSRCTDSKKASPIMESVKTSHASLLFSGGSWDFQIHKVTQGYTLRLYKNFRTISAIYLMASVRNILNIPMYKESPQTQKDELDSDCVMQGAKMWTNYT